MEQDEIIEEVNHIASEVAFGVKEIKACNHPVVGVLYITTLENQSYKLVRNSSGFNTVETNSSSSVVFETIDAFLNKVSPLYRAAFITQLHNRFSSGQ